MTDYGGKIGEILHESSRFVAFSWRFRRCSDDRIARHAHGIIFKVAAAQLRQNTPSVTTLCTVAPLRHSLSAVVRHNVFALRRNCTTKSAQSITWVGSLDPFLL